MIRKLLRPVLTLTLVPVALTALGPTAHAGVRLCDGRPATIVGTAGDDRLVGTPGPDVIAGLGGNDTITGSGGDDVLCGGAGGDDLLGGRGDDVLRGGLDEHVRSGRRTFVTGDRLQGGPGDDLLDARVDHGRRGPLHLVTRPDVVTYAASRRPVLVDLRAGTALGEGADRIVRGRMLEVDGSRGDDELAGSRLGEVLDGGRGDDHLRGRGGRDALLDYHGDDALAGGAGRDVLISTSGADTLGGGDGADLLLAGSPQTSIVRGGAGFDYIERQVSARPTGLIDGGPGGAQLDLEPQLWFDEPRLAATVDRGAGTAVVTAGQRSHTTTFQDVDAFTLWGDLRWTFRGTETHDFVQVLDGSLRAQTFGDDDVLLGGDRNDVLDGGDGTDTAWGGRGTNTCIDTEEGECDAFPTGPGAARARVHRPVAHPATPAAVLRRWLSTVR